MNAQSGQLNLIAAWLGILLGFLSGMVLGMFFHREGWLGGYASLKRRMYRLGHIALFALGAMNLLFWLTLKNLPVSGVLAGWASALFVLGAATMPLCCVVMAHQPKLHLIFSIPVVSLIAAAVLTLAMILGAGDVSPLDPQLSTLNPP